MGLGPGFGGNIGPNPMASPLKVLLRFCGRLVVPLSAATRKTDLFSRTERKLGSCRWIFVGGVYVSLMLNAGFV